MAILRTYQAWLSTKTDWDDYRNQKKPRGLWYLWRICKNPQLRICQQEIYKLYTPQIWPLWEGTIVEKFHEIQLVVYVTSCLGANIWRRELWWDQNVTFWPTYKTQSANWNMVVEPVMLEIWWEFKGTQLDAMLKNLLLPEKKTEYVEKWVVQINSIPSNPFMCSKEYTHRDKGLKIDVHFLSDNKEINHACFSFHFTLCISLFLLITWIPMCSSSMNTFHWVLEYQTFKLIRALVLLLS